ncbi:hypothetical protein DSO57_1018847 [Entomophthora muscae]|uniref:Uncharacterized protein n=1 Tax=Entomophthora muscae TaxID=34485 RepID=A0ACC2UD12_9FUNG|nr:hypothetical protein DSO57_1018847 [Entomophthora muscae]
MAFVFFLFSAVYVCFDVSTIRSKEHLSQLFKLKNNCNVIHLGGLPSAGKEGWLPPHIEPKLNNALDWSVSPPAIHHDIAAEKMSCDVIFKNSNRQKRCSQMFKQGYYWGKAIQITDMITCPEQNCIVDIAFNVSLVPLEKVWNRGRTHVTQNTFTKVPAQLPTTLKLYRLATYFYDSLVPLPGKKKFFLWAKPLYWATAEYIAETLFDDYGSTTRSTCVESYYPAGYKHKVLMAIGFSEEPISPPLTFSPPKNVSVFVYPNLIP